MDNKGSTQTPGILFFKQREITDKTTGKLKKVFLEMEGLRAESFAEVLANHEQYLEQIPVGERYNIFFTLAITHPGRTEDKHGKLKSRQIYSQNIIPIDIDNVKHVQNRDVATAVGKLLGFDWYHAGVVGTGNGIHIYAQVKEAWDSPDYFDQSALGYQAMCERINNHLAANRLSGNADPAMWMPGKMARLPGTWNKKAGKDSKKVTLGQPTLEMLDWSWSKVSGKAPDKIDPKVKPSTEGAEPEFILSFASPDTNAVLGGCKFLKHCADNPAEITEPNWYSMISITAHLDKGVALTHKLSKGHKTYSLAETDEKIKQAKENSGPKSCYKINQEWGGCQGCPYQGKIKSPIQIQGKDFIATKDTGFYTQKVDKYGNPSPDKPDYRGLLKYFDQKYRYKVVRGGGSCYVYDESLRHWIEAPEDFIKNFAYTNFLTRAQTQVFAEFHRTVVITNLVDAEWFSETTHRKINFQNGVLDIKSGKFMDHSEDFGFRQILPYDYNPGAECPRFDRFMQEITLEDSALEQVLLEFAGFALSNDKYWIHKGLLLVGDGSNGKSTFLDILKAVSGPAAYSTLTLGDLRDPQNRWQLEGKLFNVAEETPVNSMSDSTLFKTLTGGGDTMVKKLYAQPYTVKNRAKLLMSCNKLPKTYDSSTGFMRRLCIVPFRAHFGQGEGGTADVDILDGLTPELPGIFNRCMFAYKRLVKRKRFTSSAIIDGEVTDYLIESDVVYEWVQDCLKIHKVSNGVMITGFEENTAGIPDLYEAFRNFCETRGEKPYPYNNFVGKLRNYIPQYKLRQCRPGASGSRPRSLKGVEFTTDGSF